MFTLLVAPRSKGTLSSLRKSGKIPAVLYGRSERSTPIEASARDFGKLFKEAGESSVIELTGLGSPKQALINDVDIDPVTHVVRHADFYIIEKGQKVTVPVPLSFVGVSLAVKDLGGILVKVMHELELEVDPSELPHEIEVDISALSTLESQILVKDLRLPKSAAISVPDDEVVAMVSVAKEEVEEVVPMDISSIETSVERGKKDEETPADTDEKETE